MADPWKRLFMLLHSDCTLVSRQRKGGTQMNMHYDRPIEAQIADAERKWAAAFQAKDIAALQRLMADGYSLVIAVQGMPLQVVPRDAWLESLEDYRITEAAVEHIHVQIYDCVAVAVMLWRQTATLHGQDRSAEFMLTDIWVRQGDEWRLAERHSSRPEHPGAARPIAQPLECERCD
jgi:ketosteroid isomerase-like protein